MSCSGLFKGYTLKHGRIPNGDSRSMTQFRSYYWKIWYDRNYTKQPPFKSPGPESRPETPNRVNTEDLVWFQGLGLGSRF